MRTTCVADAGAAEMDDRPDSNGLWQDTADAVVVGLRRAFDYQREIADDYRARFVDEPLRTADNRASDWRGFTSGLTEYGTSVVELTFNYYRDLADIAGRLVEDTYPRVTDGNRATTYYGPGGRHPQHATVEVRGAVGERVDARFTIENSDDDAAEVLVEAGTCRAAGGVHFDADVELSPNAMLIPPDGGQMVRAGVLLDPSNFEAGGRYRIPINVSGPHPAVVELEILVEPPASGRQPEAEKREAAEDARVTRVKCPQCGRIFDRTTPSVRLRPHKGDDGNPCPERDGRRVS